MTALNEVIRLWHVGEGSFNDVVVWISEAVISDPDYELDDEAVWEALFSMFGTDAGDGKIYLTRSVNEATRQLEEKRLRTVVVPKLRAWVRAREEKSAGLDRGSRRQGSGWQPGRAPDGSSPATSFVTSPDYGCRGPRI